MKKRFLLVLAVFMLMSVSSYAQWVQDTKPFVDTTLMKGSLNNLHGMVVDPNGYVWVGDYGVYGLDSIKIFNGTYTKVRAILVFKPDGSQVSFSPILYLSFPDGTKDTVGGYTGKNSSGAAAWIAETGRGMARDKDGNILASMGGRLYKIDYKTGKGLAKWYHPADASLVQSCADANGTIFVGNVAPNANPIRMLDNSLKLLDNAVDTSRGYSRGFECSTDGNSIFWAGYSLSKVIVYKRADEFSPFKEVDSLMVGAQPESIRRDKRATYKDHLWICSGPGDAAPIGYTPHTWYLVNPATKKAVDSVTFPGLLATSANKHRAIDMTAKGDTMYLTQYNAQPSIVRMIKKSSSVYRDQSAVVENYALSQNFPNPFNPVTEIKFSVAKAGNVSLKVYDMLGKEVATLVNEELTAGNYNTRFDASRLASGMYIYQLSSNGIVLSKKMTLMK
ncbi:MAG: T9SS type A sorting domain-containing protein [Syntrophothermus sp.]